MEFFSGIFFKGSFLKKNGKLTKNDITEIFKGYAQGPEAVWVLSGTLRWCLCWLSYPRTRQESSSQIIWKLLWNSQHLRDVWNHKLIRFILENWLKNICPWNWSTGSVGKEKAWVFGGSGFHHWHHTLFQKKGSHNKNFQTLKL